MDEKKTKLSSLAGPLIANFKPDPAHKLIYELAGTVERQERTIEQLQEQAREDSAAWLKVFPSSEVIN